MGTPEIAARCLAALLDAGHEIVALVCQPDKPKGRGMTLKPPETKVLAEARGIPVFQPEKLKDEALLPLLEETKPTLIAVVAYGKILPPYILHYPPLGCINLHVSLLPKYRGAAPMQRAIMAGETETGVTVMQMDEGMDTGDILATEKFPIGPEDDFGTVHDTSARLGAALLCRTVAMLEAGQAVPHKQPAEGVCYADKISKEDTVLDFNRPAAVLGAQIRGLSPVPLAVTKTPDGRLLKIIKASVTATAAGKPGEVIALDTTGEGGIIVACGEGALVLHSVLPEGKGRMHAADMIRGRKIRLGDILGL